MSVDIPVSRLQKPGDAWNVSADRAETVRGCWFKKEEGLAHARLIRKKDRKVWEQDLNLEDGSWHAGVEPRPAAPPQPRGSVSPIYFAAELAPTKDIPPEAPLCYRFIVSGLDEQLRKLRSKYPGLYEDKIFYNPEGGSTLSAKRRDESGNEIVYFYSTNPTV